MTVVLICPVPAEFNACREALGMRELPPLAGCRSAGAVIGGVEIRAVESGPAKARAAAATAAACAHLDPDLVLDSGSCAGLEPGSAVGRIVLATVSYEYDIAGGGIPRRNLPAMKLPAAFALLDAADAESLQRDAVEIGRKGGGVVTVGPQACGELLVQSPSLRLSLHTLFRAAGANWESAGVFVAASRSGVPSLSVRIVTDLGDQQALHDFRKHVRGKSLELYRYVAALAEGGWLTRFGRLWGGLGAERREALLATVWPSRRAR